MTYHVLGADTARLGDTVSVQLEAHLDGAEAILLGYLHGRRTRKRARLDVLDRALCTVVLQFPPNLQYVGDSFLLGLLSTSLRTLGLVAFRKRFRVIGTDAVNGPDLDHAVTRVLALAASLWGLERESQPASSNEDPWRSGGRGQHPHTARGADPAHRRRQCD